MRSLASTVVCVTVLLVPTIGRGQPMEIVASGEVWLAPGGPLPPFGDISFGDSFSVRIVFDSDSQDLCVLDPTSCSPRRGSEYQRSSMTARVGNEEFAWSLVAIRICDDCLQGFASDSFTVSARPETAIGSAEIGGGIELLDTASAYPLDSQLLPQDLELADWSHREFLLFRGSFGESVRGSITSLVVRPVPEPLVAGLIALALVGLAAARAAR